MNASIDTTIMWIASGTACAAIMYSLALAELTTRKSYSDRSCIFGRGFFFALSVVCCAMAVASLL